MFFGCAPCYGPPPVGESVTPILEDSPGHIHRSGIVDPEGLECFTANEHVMNGMNMDELMSAKGSVNTALEKELGWLNYMIKVMWPKIRSLMIAKGTGIIIDKVGVELAKHPEMNITEFSVVFDPGSIPPRLKGLRSYRKLQQELEGLQVDTDLVWNPGKEFRLLPTIKAEGSMGKILDNMAAGFGVSSLEIDATVSVVLAPLISNAPCFGAQQVFFFDQPGIKMHISGLKSLGAIGKKMSGVMQTVIKTILEESFILPHNMMVKIRKDLPLETLISVKSPLPLGLLEVEVLEAEGLIAGDTNLMGEQTSDPYVEVRVGQGKIRTSTVSKTTSPTWNDGPDYLLVYNLNQLIRIEVFDDDLLKYDLLGLVPGYNVFWLCNDTANQKDGVWFQLVHPDTPGKPAGRLRIRVRYLDVSELGTLSTRDPSRENSCSPHLLTVKLLGLEGDAAAMFVNARATVVLEEEEEIVEDQEAAVKEASQQGEPSGFSAFLAKGQDVFRNATEALTKTAQSTVERMKDVTGFGFGSKQFGVPYSVKSTKAKVWGDLMASQAAVHLPSKKGGVQAFNLPPMVVRAVEQLRNRHQREPEMIAEMFAIDAKTVEGAAALRANFEVVWHEACHFVQRAEPYAGSLLIEVKVPATKGPKGSGNKAKMQQKVAAGLADDKGLVGAVRLHLAEAPCANGKPWSRRIRARLRRKSASSAQSSSSEANESERAEPEDDDQCDPSIGAPVEGILIEFLVEIRELEPASAAKHLEEGQSPGDRDALRHTTGTREIQIISD